MSKIGEDRRIHSLLSKEDFYKKDASKLDKKKVSDAIQKFTDYDVLDNRDNVWNLIDRGGDDGEEKSLRIYGKSLDKILTELNNNNNIDEEEEEEEKMARREEMRRYHDYYGNGGYGKNGEE